MSILECNPPVGWVYPKCGEYIPHLYGVVTIITIKQ